MSWAMTGTAMVTSVGRDRAACFEAFCRKESGVSPLRAFDPSKYRAKHAYEIDDRPPGGGDVPGRASSWLAGVVSAALADAAVELDGARVALLVGTGLRELRSLELWWADGEPFDAEALHFGRALRAVVPAGAPAATFSNACSASLFTLGLAADALALGQADVAVVAGTDAITESMFGLLDRVNVAPPEEVRPFDRGRKGVLMGDGAAAVVLEPAARAAERGRAPRAWLRGVGMSCDAHHVTAPHRDGIERAIRDAHERAGVAPADVDLVMVHGTGTVLNDETEALALRSVFGDARPAMTALKSMTGHTSGASGLVGLVTAIECLVHGRIPPTIGLDAPIAEAEALDFVVGAPRDAAPRVAQVDAFGFGGVNAVAVVERAA